VTVSPGFRAIWAHDRDAEQAALVAVLDAFRARRGEPSSRVVLFVDLGTHLHQAGVMVAPTLAGVSIGTGSGPLIGVQSGPLVSARSGTRPGAAVRVAETGRVLLR
jgi:hypothetical protein